MDWQAAVVGLCMGVGLAAAAGFRIFVPLLVAGLALRFDLFDAATALSGSPSWLASDAALACFGAATIFEVAAFKIPWVDNVLDAIAAPVALGAGALLATQFLAPVDDPFLRYGLGIVAGAGSAGVVHAAAAATRLASTTTTGGLANPLVAAGELLASVITSFLALVLPVVMAFLALVGAAAAMVLARRFIRKRRRAVA
jgi:hypothetical protein